MTLNTYLPWYLNIFFLLVVFITILWQTYYCQLLLSTEIKHRWKTFAIEGMVIALTGFIVYLVEANYSYVFTLFVLPFIWWRIWNNIHYFQQPYYDEINYNTYKQAWNALQIPVAIANENQEIILVNEAMYQFINVNLRKKFRSMKKLWDNLEKPDNEALLVHKEQGKLVLQLPNGESYWAELENFKLEGVNYMQLTLTDISGKALGRSFNASTEGQGLQQLLNNLEEIKRQEVAEEIHGRLHDFMGQRIAILQRLLSEKDFTNYSKLVPMLESVLQDMRTADLQTPQEQLENIMTSFATMGLKLRLKGKLPERQDWAQCFVNMIREGATNAVRHGEATTVEVTIKQEPLASEITIASNGKVPEVVEKGKGLQGLEKAFFALGGELNVIIGDEFILEGRVGVKDNEAFSC